MQQDSIHGLKMGAKAEDRQWKIPMILRDFLEIPNSYDSFDSFDSKIIKM